MEPPTNKPITSFELANNRLYPPTVQIVEEMSKLTGIDRMDMPPLDEVVDTKALDFFIGSGCYEGVQLEFCYCGYHITIYDCSKVEFTPKDR